MISGWRWLHCDTILAIHASQIAEHGGLPGVRDPALLQSALARPMHVASYAQPDAAALAAAYAWGISRNHPFFDGNKRTAFVAGLLFLREHGFEVAADDRECVFHMLRVAVGESTEDELAAWLRGCLTPA